MLTSAFAEDYRLAGGERNGLRAKEARPTTRSPSRLPTHGASYRAHILPCLVSKIRAITSAYALLSGASRSHGIVAKYSSPIDFSP
jgi:hypothetical protein